MECSGRLIRLVLSNYKCDSDRAFRKMAKILGNELHGYWQLIPASDGACYELVKKRTVKRTYLADEVVREVMEG